VLYTVLTTKEYPPADIDNRTKVAEQKKGFGAGLEEIAYAITHMPSKMKQLALVQFITWPGLFLMWFYYTPAVAAEIFGGESGSQAYSEGQNFAGITYSLENIVTFLFALCLPFLAGKFGKKYTHTLCLLIGGAGLIATNFVSGPDSKTMLFVVMACVGIAWSSILSMPYSMLSDCLPENKIGIYMGIFNFFIVLPEIIASLFFGSIMQNFLHNNRLLAVMIGGILLCTAGVICAFMVKEERPQ